MKIKLINSNKNALVDKEDFDNLNKFRWYLSTNGYVRSTINKKRVLIHRFLLNPKEFFKVDHIDRNPLNNKKKNLRICSSRENTLNSKPQSNKKYSKFKGVSYCNTEKRKKRWVAACELYGKRITIGRFNNELEAAKAYNNKAKEIFGEFAYINKI